MKTKKTALFLTTALAISMLAIPAQAASVTTAGSAGTTPVTVTAAATTFDVTVPTDIPLKVNADGSVTTPSNVKLVNNSGGPVKVSKISLKNGTWKLTDYNKGDRAKLAADGVDSKKLGLSLTAGGNAVVSSKDGDQDPTMDSTKWIVKGKGSDTNELPVTVGAIASAVSAEITTGETAASVVFTLAWNN